MIYLDNHSATEPCTAALEKMTPYLKEHWGASFAPHKMGQELIANLEPNYQALYDLVGAKGADQSVFTSSGAKGADQSVFTSSGAKGADQSVFTSSGAKGADQSVFTSSGAKEADQSVFTSSGAKEADRFVFTSSGAEAVGQVFFSVFLEEVRKTGKTHIIISEIEDSSTMKWAKRLEELGCTVKLAPVKNGLIDIEALQKLISPRTALISLTMAHGLTGVIQPVDEFIEIATEKSVLLHLDGTYAVGKFPILFKSDYLTFSGDRIHSVKGSGGLFAKKNAPLVPLILGSNEQAGYRGGAFDIPSFMALSAAAQQALLYLDTMALEVVRLRDLFEASVQGKVLFKEMLRLPNTSLIAFDKVHQEALLYFLSRKGVYASFGGAVNSHLASIDETAISFSLSRMTTEEELLKAAKIINETVESLQMISEKVEL